jgi:arylsulfatase A-like enzyme
MSALGRQAGRERRRRRHLGSVAMFLALACPSLLGCSRPSPPDVILVTLDTTRADHIGAYGYPRQISPEIDRFARDAVLFRHAWSTAPWTLPAHASIFTGKYPTSHGAHFNAAGGDATLADALRNPVFEQFKANRLGEEQVTLAELLQQAGYDTAAFVGGPWLSPVFGLLQGYALQDAAIDSVVGRRADELTDRAIAWMRQVPRGRPLHLLINYFDPHSPFDPPPGYDDLPLSKVPLVVTEAQVNQGRALPPQQRAAYIDRYDGEIRFMDHHFARLLEALREAGRYEGAVIVVVADHGESFGEHGLMGHARALYEDVLHVPLIVRFPGGRDAGTERDETVSVADLLLVIGREAGLSLPAGVESVPLGQRHIVLAECYKNPYAAEHSGPRFDRDLLAGIQWPWKLILPSRGVPELYRLDDDPGELRDRSADPVAVGLRTALQAAHAELKPPESSAVPAMSPEARERLRSLGYMQ